MAIPKTTLKFILLLITVVATIAMFFAPPIVQDIRYHQFADQRTLFCIPNFWNVVSNLAFLWTGLIALYKLHKKRLQTITIVQLDYRVFFIAITLISFGSAYYHWQPDNCNLVWDRLPITLACMSLLSFALAEYVSVSLGRTALFPLLLTGLFSVGYWYWGELHGCGDLRLYALVQFLPLLLLLLLLLFGQTIYKSQSGYWWLFIAYAAAKLAEHFDVAIYQITSGIVGGHALKHVLSAAGLYVLVVFFEKRTNINPTKL